MFAAAAEALRVEPSNLDARFRHIDCLIVFGRTGEALEVLRATEPGCDGDAASLLRAGETYARLHRYSDYHRCYAEAHRCAPHDRDARLNLARSLIVLGNLAGAESLLKEAIAARGDDHDAWHALARLRRWSRDDNHVDSLERLADSARDPRSAAAFLYALHKELEDLGEDERAMASLARGARALRSTLRYRVEDDVAIMEAIERAYPQSRVAEAATHGRGAGAIFVIGLPRSGTTLVDRILSSHPKVESLGELRDLTYSVMTGGGRIVAQRVDGRPMQPDLAAIGTCYMSAVSNYRGGAPLFVDKAPMNFLYAGLIRLALPGARIVLLRRNPMDSCLAIHKTLFRDGSSFACDLGDLARYYIAWHKLAAHWERSLGPTMHVVEYESVIRDQQHETRKLLEYCGLEWDPRCLDFHLNESPTATASAVQVRTPLYNSSVGRWRRHATALSPLSSALRASGIDFE